MSLLRAGERARSGAGEKALLGFRGRTSMAAVSSANVAYVT